MSVTGAICACVLSWVGASFGNASDPLEFERARASVIRGAVAAVETSIVTIETIGGAQPLATSPTDSPGPRRRPRPSRVVSERFRIAEGPTTGLIVSPDGLILTSSFNFARDPAVITVTLADGSRHVGTRLGVDYIRRLALVRIDASNLRTCGWVPHEELRVGQYAIACGRGLDAVRAAPTFGIVSALGRRNGNAVQTDAKTSPVNYGGPLIDIEGRVMGLIVPMAGAGGALAGAAWYDSGIGFAVPKDKIDFVFDRLVAGEIIEPGKIGVLLEPDEPSPVPFLDDLFDWSKGVKIREVARTSPAARAKLRSGDRILALDGRPISDLPELQRRLSDRAAGEDVTLTIKRRWRKSFDVEITLARSGDIAGLGDEPPPVSTEADTPEKEGEFPTTQPASD
ncbi:MAG: PDZ domain-containing protein [Planctomycetota bacterium]|nr:PDZ domain-containing protein [Planctomycetota bacterium]